MINLENIGGTDIEPTGGLVHNEIYVAKMEDFESIAETKKMDDSDPTRVAATIEELATIEGNHVLKTGKAFIKLNAIQDKNGIESSLIGDAKQVFENKLTVVVQGSDPKLLGSLRLLKGMKPLIVLARESGSGRLRQLGSKNYGAILSEVTPKVAAEKEGENNVTLVFSDKSVVAGPIYKGEVTTTLP
ncbi:hypothetical protein SAMN04489761_3052 [Tenacibaculum sp. MAR_2009_124]|uniref:hypothetical protein n=1 Tax=Tenacibaculum sp. MAR_2009_124 TaxID=1250059 RepID=UPI000896C738|nr:hypothetical protein [Tenacibaculum sp. MAR_2009_124]SEC45928.1 hypothetical protein SAMN04489761_3052 [Tenacibaculum sp. MAR_2009_124]